MTIALLPRIRKIDDRITALVLLALSISSIQLNHYLVDTTHSMTFQMDLAHLAMHAAVALMVVIMTLVVARPSTYEKSWVRILFSAVTLVVLAITFYSMKEHPVLQEYQPLDNIGTMAFGALTVGSLSLVQAYLTHIIMRANHCLMPCHRGFVGHFLIDGLKNIVFVGAFWISGASWIDPVFMIITVGAILWMAVGPATVVATEVSKWFRSAIV